MLKHLKGTRFICNLPKGYDDRTRLATYEGKVIIAHPDFKPCYLEGDKLIPIEIEF